MKIITITYKGWREEARKRYPDDNIVFRCPVCGFRQSVSEYRVAGAPEGSWGFSCIGRWIGGGRRAFGRIPGETDGGPCDYAGGGLFALNPIQVIFSDEKTPLGEIALRTFFDFADNPMVTP